MANPVARIFNLQRGDGRRGTLLFAYLFLIITCYTLGKTARDALFLSVFKASKLPYADMAIAFSVGVVISVYVTIARRTKLRNLMVGSLLFFAALQCGFWYLAKFRPELTWQYPVFYVWVGIVGVLAPTQVWTLANYLLTTREAKRVFGLLGAGGIAGWVASGLYSSWDDLKAGMRLYRDAGGTNAVLANVLVDLSNHPEPGSLAERAAVSLVCSPDEARVRLKRIEQLGFDEVLVVSPGGALDELVRVRDFL